MLKILNGNFNETVEEDMLIDFYADWCGPCRMLGPILEEVSSEINLNILKINVDKYPEVAKEFGVMSIPTLVLIKNKKETKRNTGFLSKEELLLFLR